MDTADVLISQLTAEIVVQFGSYQGLMPEALIEAMQSKAAAYAAELISGLMGTSSDPAKTQDGCAMRIVEQTVIARKLRPDWSTSPLGNAVLRRFGMA